MRILWLVLALCSTIVPIVQGSDGGTAQQSTRHPQFLDSFDVDLSQLSPTGRNPYFILEPGYVLSFRGHEDKKEAGLVITVLDTTRTVAGVKTRLVEERETLNGQVSEVSRNYYAISTRTQDVYYFGEEVDAYRHGKLIGHPGSWLAGVDGNRFGLAMPGDPKVGLRYYQEIAPEIAMDRARIVNDSDSLDTPAGRFTHVLVIEETSPLEPDVKEYKYYAPGIGLLKDGGLRLTHHGPR